MGFGPVAKDALSGIQRPPLTRMCSPAAAAFGAQCDLEAPRALATWLTLHAAVDAPPPAPRPRRGDRLPTAAAAASRRARAAHGILGALAGAPRWHWMRRP